MKKAFAQSVGDGGTGCISPTTGGVSFEGDNGLGVSPGGGAGVQRSPGSGAGISREVERPSP